MPELAPSRGWAAPIHGWAAPIHGWVAPGFEAVREELILSVPDYVLCTDECKGICAGCGVDLNTGTCTCKKEPDDRWAALEALKTAQHEEGRE